MVENCCYDFVKTLLKSDSKYLDSLHLDPVIVKYINKHIDENGVKYNNMVAWKGCKNKINNELNRFNSSLVFHQMQSIFYYDLATALCNNNNSMRNLIVVPNLRYCSPDQSQIIQSLNYPDSLNYFTDHCILLSFEFIRNAKEITENIFDILKLRAVNWDTKNEFMNFTFLNKNILENASLDFLQGCGVGVGVVESDFKVFRGIGVGVGVGVVKL